MWEPQSPPQVALWVLACEWVDRKNNSIRPPDSLEIPADELA
jgi:hypothetical protein